MSQFTLILPSRRPESAHAYSMLNHRPPVLMPFAVILGIIGLLLLASPLPSRAVTTSSLEPIKATSSLGIIYSAIDPSQSVQHSPFQSAVVIDKPTSEVLSYVSHDISGEELSSERSTQQSTRRSKRDNPKLSPPASTSKEYNRRIIVVGLDSERSDIYDSRICDVLIDAPMFSPPDHRMQPGWILLVVSVVTLLTASLMM
ncbi:hypothetical protein V1511DRAFT_509818 [Dipodascopsis uninucleata]